MAEAIANLANGPTWFVGEQLREGASQLGARRRAGAAVEAMSQSQGVMGSDPAPDNVRWHTPFGLV